MNREGKDKFPDNIYQEKRVNFYCTPTLTRVLFLVFPVDLDLDRDRIKSEICPDYVTLKGAILWTVNKKK